MGDGPDAEDEPKPFFMRAASGVLARPYSVVDDAVREGVDDSEEKYGYLTVAEWDVSLRQFAKSALEMFNSDEAAALGDAMSDIKWAAGIYEQWRRGEVVISTLDQDQGIVFIDNPDFVEDSDE